MGKVSVSETEYKVLKAIVERNLQSTDLKELSELTGIELSTLASIVRLLADKGLIEVKDVVEEKIVLTDRGTKAIKDGLPEEKLLNLLKERKEMTFEEISSYLGEEGGIAIGQARKRNIIDIVNNKVKLIKDVEDAFNEINRLRQALLEASRGRMLEERLVNELKRRGLLKKTRMKTTYVKLTKDPVTLLNEVRVEVSRLTHDLIKSGRWKEITLRPYNVLSEPPKVLPARKHFLTEFIEFVRDVMKELGFKEVDGPMIEIELFNFDVLFQPQDHPAREIHDTLWIREPSIADTSDYIHIVTKAKEVHEKGWRYKWDPKRAARVVLRSQTTAVSARILAKRPKPPIRYFTLGKVFRADAVDASHLSDFYQLDGIEGWEGYTFRDLLGTLSEIAERLGLSIRFKPAYFPFTEPSVEGYVRLPNGRWLELFGAGLFRPEVLEMVDISYPVGAWGFGIERLAAAYYGISDVRILYSRDYDFIRSFNRRV